jgi:predicted DsbA family dithiol-disulfide isomerase
MTRQTIRQTARQLVVYGDFTSPWSYLASRRAAALAALGVRVDWRAVQARGSARGADRFPAVRSELDLVAAGLLADEQLPYALAGFVPATAAAAVTGYAEAYAAGAAAQVRHLLFDAFWAHGCDVGDAQVVRTLVVDAIRSGSSPGDPRSAWGYAVVGDGPVAPGARRLVERWAHGWRATGLETVPVLVVDDAAPLSGAAAVAWLAEELVRRTPDRLWQRPPCLSHAG